MCGIFGIIGKADKTKALELSKRMTHRGPDESDYYQAPNGSIMCHERLSIVDLTTGLQPIKGTNEAYVVHNGEIYNHQDLRDGILKHHKFHTTCDSEVIVHLYEEFGYDFCNKLRGIFSFIVLNGDDFIVGRDPIGVKPLYYGKDKEGKLYFSSEMKSIVDQCETMEAFPPGHYYTAKTGFVKYYNPTWEDYKSAVNPVDLKKLNEALTESVKIRLMSDVPFGVLLSGGLDSSLTSSIASRLLKEKGKTLHSFSIGLDADAPDAKAARQVAEFLGTQHHEVHFTIEQGIEVLDKLISWGNSENDARKLINKNYDYAVEHYRTMKTICECIITID